MGRFLILSIVTLLISPGLLQNQSFSHGPDHQGILASYGPIEIGSDPELITTVGNEGWPGNGTEGDPFIIRDLELDGEGRISYGIFIYNTTLYLTIENCTMIEFSQSGIIIIDCSNIKITNNLLENCTRGVEVFSCSITEISDNTIKGSALGICAYKGNFDSIIDNTINLPEFEGIHIENETNCMVYRNNISLGSDDGFGADIRGCTYLDLDHNEIISGSEVPKPLKVTNCAMMQIRYNHFENGSEIYLGDTIGYTFVENEMHNVPVRLDRCTLEIRDNDFFGCGVIIDEYSSGPWLQNLDLDTTNSVNGKMILFARSNSSLNELALGSEIGQLIVFNVKEGVVSPIELGNTTVAIQVVGCDGLTIDGPTISDCLYGMIIQDTMNSSILNSNISRSGRNGIRMFESWNNEIVGNLILDTERYDQEEGGIFLHKCQDCMIEGNTVFSHLDPDSPYGIQLSWSDENVITNNYMFYNGGTGDSYRNWEFQSYDLMGNNWWNSPTDIGNYWRDWRGPDSERDGIVDLPYTIGATGALMPQDHYPLATCPVVTPPTNLSITTVDKKLMISWSEPDQTAFFKIRSYKIWIGTGTLLGHQATVNAGSLYYHHIFAQPGVEYHYMVTAVNQLIESDPSEVVRGTLEIDPTTVNITSPINGSFHSKKDITVEWEVFDNGSGLDHFEIKLDEGMWKEVELNRTKLFTDLQEGMHTVHVAAIDNYHSVQMDSVNFTVDLTEPDLTIIRPDNGSFVNTRHVIIEWTSSDELSGTAGFEVRADFGNWTPADNDKWHTLLFSNDGFHTVEVAAIDKAGNRLEKGVSFTMDTYLPELTVLSPDEGVYYRSGDVKVIWNGSDNGTGLESYWFRMNDLGWTSMGLRTDRSLWGLPDGHYRIDIKAVDIAGNGRVRSVSFFIDGTSPNLRILDPVDGSFISNSPVTVRWNGTDDTSGIDHFEIRIEGDQWRDVGDDLTFTMVNLMEGIYLFSVRTWDRAGNDITVSTSFTLDQTRPEVVTFSPVGNEVDVDTVISMTFNERMHIPTMQFHMDDVKGELVWKGDRLIFMPGGDLNFGTDYTVTAVGWDLAGNRLENFVWKFTTHNKGTVQGYIVDKRGRPVEFARIYALGENGTRSREDGFFTIDLTAGNRTVLFEAEGFRTVKLEMEIEPGEVHVIDRLVLSEDNKSPLSLLSCLLWAFLVMVSMMLITGVALWLSYRARDHDIPEE
ncbi:MAG: right-handed parallel beta-helix repeat-containing protein [Candidatus Thermoplasmatota archaeon]|nr:right-handed parallel beta-helix repeat-containing protein [Candidatus Thermoplasmatota archaeon]